MSSISVLIPPTESFWPSAADAMKAAFANEAAAAPEGNVGWRVVVSTAEQIGLCREALRALHAGSEEHWIPPRIVTFADWLERTRLLPEQEPDSARLLRLYSALRETGWLKKMFGARRNTELLPLAELLVSLSDELSEALLPLLPSGVGPESEAEAAQRWDQALALLPPAARSMLSDEAKLVWGIWRSQLDQDDPTSRCMAAGKELAELADEHLVWINPVEPDPIQSRFLQHYAQRHIVLRIGLDWRAEGAPSQMVLAWPEIFDVVDDRKPVRNTGGAGESFFESSPDSPPLPVSQFAMPALMPADSLEQEARQGARRIVSWLQEGRKQIAIIAQDRVVARRLVALLAHAEVRVHDETGWKLSTTRAAAALLSWCDCVSTRGDSVTVLDFLKSPFVLPSDEHKSRIVLQSELHLRRHNMAGGWMVLQKALADIPGAAALMTAMTRCAQTFSGRHFPAEWFERLTQMSIAFGLDQSWQRDTAGQAVQQALSELALPELHEPLSMAELRAWLIHRMDAIDVPQPGLDRRVSMLPLNGGRLRQFDAVLVIGADSARLPSAAKETLFFANAVRAELGLATREKRQQQQLRDLAALILATPVLVFSWQSRRHGESNPVSPWLQRLQLVCEQRNWPGLSTSSCVVTPTQLTATPVRQPQPRAPMLLPQRLSASGYNSFFSCPYQFFAGRMLGLSTLDDWQDGPEKRDYGDWLHQILHRYHEHLQVQPAATEQREALLLQISTDVFERQMALHAGALAFHVRWQKMIPAYIDWANRHEAAGWQVESVELSAETWLPLSSRDMVLNGRIDRVDVCRAEHGVERMVIDYKSGAEKPLKDKIKHRTDWQLPFYGLLTPEPPERAVYLPLSDADKVAPVEADDYHAWTEALGSRLTVELDAVLQGAPLPANGAETTCAYCDMRGLCRRGAWS